MELEYCTGVSGLGYLGGVGRIDGLRRVDALSRGITVTGHRDFHYELLFIPNNLKYV